MRNNGTYWVDHIFVSIKTHACYNHTVFTSKNVIFAANHLHVAFSDELHWVVSFSDCCQDIQDSFWFWIHPFKYTDSLLVYWCHLLRHYMHACSSHMYTFDRKMPSILYLHPCLDTQFLRIGIPNWHLIHTLLLAYGWECSVNLIVVTSFLDQFANSSWDPTAGVIDLRHNISDCIAVWDPVQYKGHLSYYKDKTVSWPSCP